MKFLIQIFFAFAFLFLPELYADTLNEYLIKLSPQQNSKFAGITNTDSLFQAILPGNKIKMSQRLFLNYKNILDDWILIQIDDKDIDQINKLKHDKIILSYQKNNQYKLHNLPNDPLYDQQWYLAEIEVLKARINFSLANPVLLAVIDTGIDYNHPDLQGSLWINSAEDKNNNGIIDPWDNDGIDDDGNGYIDDVSGWDFVDAPRFPDNGDYLNPDNDPMDEYQSGHGTQIAGIISAQRNNDIGIAGITPETKIMNLRAGTAGGYLEEDDVARAIIYAIENGARVINMSFGDVVVSRFMKDVIRFAYDKDIVLVASSGNSGTNELHYPSGFHQVISVGASADSGALAGFSSWGQTLDLVAPGIDIKSTSIGGGYNNVNGTSFSAPMVAAGAAMLLSDFPYWTNEQVRNVLKTSSTDQGYTGWDEYYGAGNLNLNNASLIKDGSSLIIHSPETGHYTNQDSMAVVATVQDNNLLYYSLQYGLGKNPDEWYTISENMKYQVIQDTINIINISSYNDTTISLRLVSMNWKREISGYHSFFNIDKSKPVADEVNVISMYVEDRHGALIEFKSDDISNGSILYRRAGSNDPYQVRNLEYETKNHKVLFTSDIIHGDIEFYLKLRNLSGLISETRNENDFKFNISGKIIPAFSFNQLSRSLPAGYLADFVTDFDNDGNDEIVLSRYDQNKAFGPVEIYEFENGMFQKRFETGFPVIPRSSGDADGDGKEDLLLGYGKNSFLFEPVSENNFTLQMVWSDSTDFWASQISNLDNDVYPEIIGRINDIYVQLESNGDNNFEQVFEFENLSEGINTFGPPKTINADFDNDGLTEFVFGDYDGDVIIYENTGDNSFKQNLITRLHLPDATDYLISGDIISEDSCSFLAGCHTSDDINFEHEFNARYWSFSHFIPEQDDKYAISQNLNFFGYFPVKEYDSGFSAGKISGQTDWIFIAPFPNLYILKYDGSEINPVSFLKGVHTNTVLMHDFDGNDVPEIYLNNGNEIVCFETGTSLQPP